MTVKPVEVEIEARRELWGIAGRDRGERYRQEFSLDEADRKGDDVIVRFPEHVISVSGSFVAGLLDSALSLHGEDYVRKHYQIQGCEDAKKDVADGVAWAARLIRLRKLDGSQ